MDKLFPIIFAALLIAGCAQQVQTENQLPSSKDTTIAVSFAVNDGAENILEKTLEVEKGTIALDALRQATVVGGKQYEFGFFIESIAGVEAGQSHYWAIYVDNVYAEKGIDQIVLDKGTNLRFVLEEIREF